MSSSHATLYGHIRSKKRYFARNTRAEDSGDGMYHGSSYAAEIRGDCSRLLPGAAV